MINFYKEFKNKVVIVTGGTGGIGWEVALAFAKAGATVVILARNKAKLESCFKKLSALSSSLAIVADVSNLSQVLAAVKKIQLKFKRIDALVNCAGVLGPVGETDKVFIKNFQKTLDINFFGTLYITTAVLPIMKHYKKGKIINLSGGGAVQPRPYFSAYAVSKTAVVRLTENLASEYKKYNIQINSIAPGAINTKFLFETLNAGKKAGRVEYLSALKQKQNGGDSAEAAANLVLFLCSSKAYGLTGKLISAKWDSWQKWDKSVIKKINKTSEYTLRRIDNKYFYEK